jgi:hypothetical protein
MIEVFALALSFALSEVREGIGACYAYGMRSRPCVAVTRGVGDSAVRPPYPRPFRVDRLAGHGQIARGTATGRRD